jgi:hypothetical protein
MTNANAILLKNVIIKYNHIQDRLCMAGAFGDGGLISAWLTQRLIKSFLQKILAYLTTQTNKTIYNQTSEDVLKKKHVEQIQMVRDFIDELGAQNIHPLLISNIKIKLKGEHVFLVFEIQDDPRSLVLPLTESNLKKWLRILNKQCVRSNWNMDPLLINLNKYLKS